MGRKIRLTLGMICCLFLAMPTAAFAWNQATHAYIADRLGATAGHDNLLEIWGSTAPDFFNYIFDPALCPGWVSDQTHGMHADTFLNAWNAAASDSDNALAYGFVTHNEPWGADHTAHEACRTCGQDDGYVIVKARQLLGTPLNPVNPLLTLGAAFATLGMDPDEAQLIAHVSAEYAVDIRLGHDADPLLARKLATAARSDTKGFRLLLVRAYAAGYAAAARTGKAVGGRTSRKQTSEGGNAMNALTAMKHPGALYERLRDFTRIIVTAVLVILAILVSPIATRAEPFNNRGCAWPLVLSPEGSGNIQGPDGAARYWLMPFDTQYQKMTIKGTYPNIRFFSFTAYETIDYDAIRNTNSGFHLAEHHLYDAQIAPDPGSINPFVPPGGRNGKYTVVISRTAPSSGNTIGVSPDLTWVALRMYVTDADPSLSGQSLMGGDGDALVVVQFFSFHSVTSYYIYKLRLR